MALTFLQFNEYKELVYETGFKVLSELVDDNFFNNGAFNGVEYDYGNDNMVILDCYKYICGEACDYQIKVPVTIFDLALAGKDWKPKFDKWHLAELERKRKEEEALEEKRRLAELAYEARQKEIRYNTYLELKKEFENEN